MEKEELSEAMAGMEDAMIKDEKLKEMEEAIVKDFEARKIKPNSDTIEAYLMGYEGCLRSFIKEGIAVKDIPQFVIYALMSLRKLVRVRKQNVDKLTNLKTKENA